MAPLLVTGMFGIGDNLHQRAVLRALMAKNEVYLRTFYVSMFRDLADAGLKLLPLKSSLAPRIREGGAGAPRVATTPRNGLPCKISYSPAEIQQHGSILAAMFASVGLTMPERPDFSLPVPEAWREKARALLAGWNTGGKPVMVYRPICLNTVWNAPARAPDPKAYAALFRSVRDRFFVVSLADLTQKEWIVGDEQDVDLKFHHGELGFETLAGLVAEAQLVFANPGFMPVLAQAVGTANVIVYGGNESFRTTNAVGAHLAPTLAIEPDRPCECHSRTHDCDKTITLAPALERLEAFVSEHVASQPKVLVFGTVYVDTDHKARLVKSWAELHQRLNPGCDFLLVDSASPEFWCADGSPSPQGVRPDVEIWSFPDNIGHLARGGRDGWGRAFCKGIERAIDGGYDYVVHIEGDSLFRLPVMPNIGQMARDKVDVLSVPVEGTKRPEVNWVETGLMMFRVGFLRESQFVERYDWQKRTAYPTPERVIFDLLGDRLKMAPWKAARGDKKQITADNAREFDWITHCWENDAVYAAFAADGAASAPAGVEQVKIHLGCGTNRLAGWVNCDSDVDITKRLPWTANHADYVFIEHCVEHVDYYAALKFFAECRRILKPGGALRVVVPSIENVRKHATQAYCAWVHTKKWAPSADVRGAMHAILFCHGHKAAWTASLLEASLFYAGFDQVIAAAPHKSAHAALNDVEGHHKVIGEAFNAIESIVAEATK